jgi:hypothetical protein
MTELSSTINFDPVDHSCSVAALDPGSVNLTLQLGANLMQDEEENKRGPHHFTAFADSLLAQCVDRVALTQPLHGNSMTGSITKELVTTMTQIDSSLEDV